MPARFSVDLVGHICWGLGLAFGKRKSSALGPREHIGYPPCGDRRNLFIGTSRRAAPGSVGVNSEWTGDALGHPDAAQRPQLRRHGTSTEPGHHELSDVTMHLHVGVHLRLLTRAHQMPCYVRVGHGQL